uniref:Putative hydroxypyruvate isomerase n=1 Tax=Ascaris suum TaxID=6253 RepID=F1LBV7_ASCSU
MRVAANLSTMFQRVDLLQRYEKAASMGFRCVEVSIPYSQPAEMLKAEADRLKLQHVLINSPPGDWLKGDRGIAAIPTHKNDFGETLETAVKYANTLAVKKIHVMAGIIAVNDEAKRTYVDNIRAASRRFARDGIMCLIEPINHISIPGYFLSTYEQAIDVIKEINEPNLKIMFDVFHAQQISGKLAHSIASLKPYIGHVQVAQVPDRHEPDSDGEINYKYIFEILKKNGDWDVGCEYLERGDTADYVEWVHANGLVFG